MYSDAVRTEMHCSKIGIESISPVVGPKPSSRYPVRPGREEGNPVELFSPAVPEGRYIRQWEVEKVLTMHLQFESPIAERRCNRNAHLMGRIGQANHVDAVIRHLLGG